MEGSTTGCLNLRMLFIRTFPVIHVIRPTSHSQGLQGDGSLKHMHWHDMLIRVAVYMKIWLRSYVQYNEAPFHFGLTMRGYQYLVSELLLLWSMDPSWWSTTLATRIYRPHCPVWGNTLDLTHQKLVEVLAAVIPHIVVLHPVNNNPDELVGF